MTENRKAGDWELSKENIQPLSSGRKMAYLSDALPSSGGGLNDHQHESCHLEGFRKLLNLARQDNSVDPICTWIEAINYIEQHFPSMNPKITTVYIDAIKESVQTFYGDERYRCDKRYIDLLLKCVETMGTAQFQLRFVKQCLENDGIGELNSDMYVKIAEIYEGLEDEKNALLYLRLGIDRNAQPKCVLEEIVTYVQNRWAERYVKQLQETIEDGADARKFGSSVPTVGEKNEAVSIRRDLEPAGPANILPKETLGRSGRPQQQARPMFSEESTSQENFSENFNFQRSLSNVGRKDIDQENHLKATKWNASSAQIDNPIIPQPHEKIQLYIDSSNSYDSQNSQSVDKRILKERKEESGGTALISVGEKSANNVENKQAENIDIFQNAYAPLPVVKKRKDIFENIKYKTLPPGRRVNRIMIKSNAWKLSRVDLQRQRELDECESIALRRKLEYLMKANEVLEEKLKEQQRLTDLKLQQKDEKIKHLETENEKTINELTRISTSNNIRDSQYLREKRELMEQLDYLTSQIEEKRQLEKELELCRLQCEELKHKMAFISSTKQDSESLEGMTHTQNNSNMNEIDTYVSNRKNQMTLTQECTVEENRLHSSGENTASGNSFLPVFETEKSVNVEPLKNHKGGLIDRPMERNMLDITAPPDLPPPSFGNFNSFRKSSRPFSLYESISDSFSNPITNAPNVNQIPVNKRVNIIKNLHTLSENVPPPVSSITGTYMQENASYIPQQSANVVSLDQENGNFRRPILPSCKSVTTNAYDDMGTYESENTRREILKLPNCRRRQSIPLRTPAGDDASDEDEDFIVRRHQQTGADLNISNLTTVLALGPKPLTNSTPEKLKDNGFGRHVSLQSSEDPAASDFPGACARMSRYNSILNDPALNLSTIQETSRENRSRSTTGSSSGNMTTRYGMATSTTQFYNVTRSASIPRSAGHLSQIHTNGYYSDTNGK